MTYQPGDIGFARTKGLMGRAIRWGEQWHFRGGDAFNHAFVLHHRDPISGEWIVVQAEAEGVTCRRTLAEVAPGGSFEIRRPPQPFNVAHALDWLDGEVGDHYGWLTIGCLVFDITSPDWFPAVRRANSWICSAVTAEYLRVGGWLHRYGDIYIVNPAQLAEDTKGFEVVTA